MYPVEVGTLATGISHHDYFHHSTVALFLLTQTQTEADASYNVMYKYFLSCQGDNLAWNKTGKQTTF